MKPKESYRLVWMDFSEYEGMKNFHKPLLLTISAGMTPAQNRFYTLTYDWMTESLKYAFKAMPFEQNFIPTEDSAKYKWDLKKTNEK